jgi:hypothetical protein
MAGAGMHNTWPVLALAWKVAIVTFLVMIIFSGRVPRWVKRINSGVVLAVSVLIAIRIFGRHWLHDGLIYQFALVFAGFAAAIGILVQVAGVIARHVATSDKQSTEIS